MYPSDPHCAIAGAVFLDLLPGPCLLALEEQAGFRLSICALKSSPLKIYNQDNSPA